MEDGIFERNNISLLLQQMVLEQNSKYNLLNKYDTGIDRCNVY